MLVTRERIADLASGMLLTAFPTASLRVKESSKGLVIITLGQGEFSLNYALKLSVLDNAKDSELYLYREITGLAVRFTMLLLEIGYNINEVD